MLVKYIDDSIMMNEAKFEEVLDEFSVMYKSTKGSIYNPSATFWERNKGIIIFGLAVVLIILIFKKGRIL